MEILSELSQYGLVINFPVVLLTIMVSGYIIRIAKKKGAHPYINISVPFVIGILLFVLWQLKSEDGLHVKDAFDAILNTAIAVGTYAPVASYLKKKGMMQ